MILLCFVLWDVGRLVSDSGNVNLSVRMVCSLIEFLALLPNT